jgi:WD40 repeat protein
MENGGRPAEMPYVGLVPYAEEDAPFFFGREPECEIIAANLLASRLTLLYGASGVGKSSLLRAGVAHALREQARDSLAGAGTPESVVVVFSAWRDDPVAGLSDAVREAVARTLDAPLPEPDGATSLIDTLQRWTERLDSDLLIILDQFEEYFLYHAHEDGSGSFAVEFPRAVNRRDLRVNFLIAIREDALAKLDRFKGRIPNVFDNYLRIEHLDRPAGKAAIERPIAEYNRRHGDNGARAEIAPALVESVLDQVGIGQVVLGESGRGTVNGAAGSAGGDARIETPFLQLVMTRLWEEERLPEEWADAPHQWVRTLRLDTLNRLGGAERIVRTHLDGIMATLPPEEQDIAARVFDHLVTASGTKIAHTAADLAAYARLPEERIAPVLEKLSAGTVRILRPVPPPLDQPGATRYEVFHDVLAAAILDWRTRYIQEQERAEAEAALTRERAETEARLAAERRRSNRLRLGVAGLSLLLLLMIGLVAFAFQQRSTARDAERSAEAQRDAARRAESIAQSQEQIAAARELVAASNLQLPIDPERSILLALRANKMNIASGRPPLPEIEDTLRHAVQTSRAIFTLTGHTAEVARVTFSADGTRLFTNAWDGTAGFWDTATGKQVHVLDGNAFGLIRDANNGAVSPDGALVAIGYTNGSVKLVAADSGSVVFTLAAHVAPSLALRFSPDGRQLGTSGSDRLVKVWDVATGQELLTLSGHTQPVTNVRFSGDGRRISSMSPDGEARIWDLSSGELIRSIRATPVYASHALSHDGTRLATQNASRWNLWDITTGVQLPIEGRQINNISMMEFSPDGTKLATGSVDKTARIWDLGPSSELFTLSDPDGLALRGVEFSPDGTRIATAHQSGGARVWDAATGKQVSSIATGRAATVMFSPDSILLAVSGGEGVAGIWNLATGELVHGLPGHMGAVYGLAFSPDGRTLATGAEDRVVKLWDVATGQEIRTLGAHSGQAYYVAFSPDGTRLAVAVGWLGNQQPDGVVQVWDVTTGQPVMTLSGHRQAVWWVAYSKDGSRIVSTSNDGTAKVWDSTTGQLLLTLVGHTSTVVGAAFSPDGSRIATAATDSTARIWDATTGLEIATLTGHTLPVFGIAISPDSKKVVTASGDGTARVYLLRKDDLVTLARQRLTRTWTPDECRRFLHTQECPPTP